MNEPVPTKPHLLTIEQIDKPPASRLTIWAMVLAVALALPEVIQPIIPILPDKYSEPLAALAAMVAAVAAILARRGGVDAAGRVREQVMGRPGGEGDQPPYHPEGRP